MYVILIYDVSQDRVGKVCKFLRTYLNWIQNSAFEGEVSEAGFKKIKTEIKKLIKEEDSVIMFKINNSSWLDKEILGKEKSSTDNIF